MTPLPTRRASRRAVLVAAVVAASALLSHDLALAQEDAASAPSTQPAGRMIEGERGLKYQVLAEAPGDRVAQAGDVVMVHYTGKLEDGTIFDTSRQVRRGQREPFPVPITLRLGDGMVIPGWELGLTGMKVGEKRQLVIPPDLAYGAEGRPPVIPPSATLVFDVELVGLARDAG